MSTVAIPWILATAWAAQPPPPPDAAADPVVVLGRILAPDGAPIEDARVRHREGDTRSGPNGRFSLRAPAAGTLWIHAERRRSLRVRYRLEGLERRLDLGDLVLDRGHTLAGRIVDEHDRPVAGARVEAIDLLGGSVVAARQALVAAAAAAVTDGDGRFRLPGLPAGGLELRARAEGCFTVRRRPVDLATPLTLVARAGGYVAGRVLEADGRRARAKVQILYELEDATQEVFTGPEGRFRTTRAHPVPYVVTARISAVDGRRARTGVLEGPREDLVLRLPEYAGYVRLLVLGPTGRPAPRVRAVLVTWGTATDDELADLLLETPWRPTAGGEIALPVTTPDVPIHLAVQAPDSAPRILHDLKLPLADAPPMEVRLPAPVGLHVQMVDGPTKEPLAGVRVWAMAPLAEGQGIELTPRAGLVPRRAVLSDSNGDVLLRLPPRLLDLVVLPPDRPPLVLRKIDLRHAKEDAGSSVVVNLPRGATLRGLLRGEPGAPPAPPARVRLEHAEGGWMGWTAAPLFDHEVEVAPDGTFSAAGLDRGTWRAWLVHPRPAREGPRLETLLGEFQVREPKGRVEVAFDRAAAQPTVLAGRLRLEGDPVPWSRIALCAVPPEWTPTRPWESLRNAARHVAVGPDGACELPVPPERPFDPAFVDVVTGLVLARCATVQGLPGERVPCEATLRAARITVRLRGSEGARAARLEIRTLSTEVDNPSASIFTRDDMDLGIGLRLEPDQDEVTFWAPPGRVRVLARSIRQRLEPRTSHRFLEPLAVAEVRATAGGAHVVTLRLRARAEVR